MKIPRLRVLKPPEPISPEAQIQQTSTGQSLWQFFRWMGPALMVSIAYMDPGNYGTDIAAGAGYKYDLLWAVWLASSMAMLLQYLSGKLGIGSGYHLVELVKMSAKGRRLFVIPYWLASEAAIAATDLAEYLGTVLALNLLFGVPMLYAAIFGALDVIILLTMMGRRFSVIEQYFAILVSVLTFGIFYNLVIVAPNLGQIAFHSVAPIAPDNTALLIVVGIIGATVMPHALYVHSWLTKNKMDLLGRPKNGVHGNDSAYSLTTTTPANHHPYSIERIQRTRKLHLKETVLALTIAGIVNAGILLVATPLYPNATITVNEFVSGISSIYGSGLGVIFVLTLLASGLSSSALGTIAGQVVMEGLIGKHINVWFRRIVTRGVNVFPTTIAILVGLDPLHLLVYSQVILSLMIPVPMIPLVYYTSRTKFMSSLVNRRITTVLALMAVVTILAFNSYLLFNVIKGL